MLLKNIIICFIFLTVLGRVSCVDYGIFGTFNYVDVPGGTSNLITGEVDGFYKINATFIILTHNIKINIEDGTTFDSFKFGNGLGKMGANSNFSSIDLKCDEELGSGNTLTCTSNLVYSLEANVTEYKRIFTAIKSSFIDPYKNGYYYIDVFLQGEGSPKSRALISVLYPSPCIDKLPNVTTVGLFGTFAVTTLLAGTLGAPEVTGVVSGYIQYNSTYFNITSEFKIEHKPQDFTFAIYGPSKIKQNDNQLNGSANSFTFNSGNRGVPSNASFINTGYNLFVLPSENDYISYSQYVDNAIENPTTFGSFYFIFVTSITNATSNITTTSYSRSQLRLYKSDITISIDNCPLTYPPTSPTTATTLTSGGILQDSSSNTFYPNYLLILFIILLITCNIILF